jgi:hypothetical protein
MAETLHEVHLVKICLLPLVASITNKLFHVGQSIEIDMIKYFSIMSSASFC